MADIIKLLPDKVANQIAAGEVIQRPASAVKELLENSIDAGASEIKLIIKDAGKTLIQVTDNGCGMTAVDARMSLERHATSKISNADDLFKIRTMGFRGEALPSIAAIAMLEIKSRRHEDEVATCIELEGSIVKKQYPISASVGTSIAVKNLFFNVPARRNFLKSNKIELNHILEEFIRIALANSNVKFEFYDNNALKYKLQATNLKQRIVNLFSESYKEKLLIIEQQTELAKINGYIVKPEFCRKSRGEQYFFVNNRFIRHNYLNHSVQSAYEDIITSDTYPGYFIFIDIDPARIDVNIHPTKTEVNFLDNQHLYAMLRSTIKRSLGMFNVTPSLDFETEKAFDYIPKPGVDPKQPEIKINPDYNPFTQEKRSNHAQSFRNEESLKNWHKLYDTLRDDTQKPEKTENQLIPSDSYSETIENKPERELDFIQSGERFILCPVKSGIMIIDHKRASERILFEKIVKQFENQKNPSQQELFPQTIDLQPTDTETMNELLPDLLKLGFDIEHFGNNTFIIRGTPADLTESNPKDLIENLIQNYKSGLFQLRLDKRSIIAKSIAANASKRKTANFNRNSINTLINSLFSCKSPEISPSAEPVIKIIKYSDVEDLFT